MSAAFIGFLLFAFLGVVLLLQTAWFLWQARYSPQARRFRERLAGVAVSRSLSLLGPGKAASNAQAFWMRSAWTRRFAAWLRSSGQDPNPTRFAALTALMALTSALIAAVFRLPLAMVLGAGLIGAAVPALRVASARRRRLQTIEAQLPQALDLMSRALRAGHAFAAALQMVATEASQPIAGEFRTTVDEIQLGIPVPQAMADLAHRVPSVELRFFVVSVLLQRESGGNLTEILSNLSKLMRDRADLLGRVRVLSAEGRLSAWILTGLPFATAGLVYWASPSFMAVLWTDPVGLRLLTAALGLLALGIVVMNQLVRIRV